MINEIMKSLSTDRPFVYDHNSFYTYHDLQGFCKRLERVFKLRNIRKILICLPQSFEAYGAVICSFISNVTFCSIRSDDPLNRKASYIEVFQPDLVLTDESNNIVQAVAGDRLIYVSDLENQCEDVISEEDKWYSAEQDIAYVMFTSGSTGFPKGVKIKRTALLNIVDWMSKNFMIEETDICSQYSNMSFDMSLIDIFVAVTAGASLVPFSSFRDKLFPGAKIKKFCITFWHSVPNVIDILQEQKHLVPEFIGTIKKCKFGGEQIYATQLERFFNVLPDATAFLTYGTTEITFICTCVKTNKNNYMEYAKKNMALGFPVDGWNITLDNVEQGIGEIVVYGDNIGAGYINQNQGNSRFRKILINGKNEDAYFTGDLGTYIDGVLYYLGRRDFQVKSNGNRIDLSEIDRVVRNIEGCIAAYTLFYNKKIIVAYIGESLDEAEIRRVLSLELPKAYMPHQVICCESFPKNNSGKIDRNELINKLIENKEFSNNIVS